MNKKECHLSSQTGDTNCLNKKHLQYIEYYGTIFFLILLTTKNIAPPAHNPNSIKTILAKWMRVVCHAVKGFSTGYGVGTLTTLVMVSVH